MMPQTDETFEEWLAEYQGNRPKAPPKAGSDLWRDFYPSTVRGKAAEAKRKASRPPAPRKEPPSSLVWPPKLKAEERMAAPPPPVTLGKREFPMARLLELRPSKAMGVSGTADTVRRGDDVKDSPSAEEPVVVELPRGQAGAPQHPRALPRVPRRTPQCQLLPGRQLHLDPRSQCPQRPGRYRGLQSGQAT